jgi:hypothetical protein
MHQETTVSIQHTAQVVERARHVDVGNIDVPVLVGLWRLLNPRPFARGLALPSRGQGRSDQQTSRRLSVCEPALELRGNMGRLIDERPGLQTGPEKFGRPAL